jgi:hypothetical protein
VVSLPFCGSKLLIFIGQYCARFAAGVHLRVKLTVRSLIDLGGAVSPRPLLFVGAFFWMAVVGAGFAALARYDNAPGALGERTPSRWPPLSRLSRTPGLPNLIVMLHPQCPCSRATLGNLERAMPELQDKTQVHLVFVHRDTEDRRDDNALLRIAKAIPGTEIFQDQAGRETELFGVLTSGETLLYSREGTLLFHGGITFGRSHEGGNPGLSAIVEFIQHGVANRSSTSVFGCALMQLPKHQATVNHSTGAVQ